MQLQNSYMRNLLVDSNADIGWLDLVNCLRYLHLQKGQNIRIKSTMIHYQKGKNLIAQYEFKNVLYRLKFHVTATIKIFYHHLWIEFLSIHHYHLYH